MRRKLQGPRSPDVAASLNNLARCSKEQGDYIRAEELFRQALEMITGLAGESDLSTSHATHNLAACVLEMGRPQEAEALFSKALALRLKKLKATHPLVLSSRLGLARAKFAEEPGVGPLKEAQEALQGLETELSGDHPDVADGDVAVGEMLMTMDRAPEAEPLLRRALTITQTPKQPVPADLAEMRVRLGLCIAKQGHASGSKERLVEAKGLLLAGYEALPKGGRRTGLRAGAAKELAALYRADGEPEKAARFERAPTEESR
jgi:tetratricopeptide (TPR) repeat protein